MRWLWVLAGACIALGLWLAVPTSFAHADATEETPAGPALDPDFAAGKKAIDAKDWSSAVRALSSAALRDTRNADIQNYLGFAYRHLGKMNESFQHYEKALELNPRHRGAHEYIGEAYLMQDNLAKAQEHLAALEKICLTPCDEYGDLQQAIAAYRKRTGK